MKASIPVIVATLLALGGCASTSDRQYLRFDGEFGPLMLEIDWDAGRFTGRSPKTESRLSGGAVRTRNDGGLLTGIWTQPTSERRCNTTRNGSRYWGQFVLTLDDEDTPEAFWGYCDDPPRKEWPLDD